MRPVAASGWRERAAVIVLAHCVAPGLRDRATPGRKVPSGSPPEPFRMPREPGARSPLPRRSSDPGCEPRHSSRRTTARAPNHETLPPSHLDVLDRLADSTFSQRKAKPLASCRLPLVPFARVQAQGPARVGIGTYQAMLPPDRLLLATQDSDSSQMFFRRRGIGC